MLHWQLSWAFVQQAWGYDVGDSNDSVRYAIRFPSGQFSNGRSPVDLDEAKLWRLRGHLSSHLGRFIDDDGCGSSPYPEGCEVVEVVVSTTVSPVCKVADEEERIAANRRERVLKRRRAFALDRLERAKRQLRVAEEAAGVRRG